MGCHCLLQPSPYLFLKFKFIYFNWRLLYNIVLVLPYINMNPPWVYTCFPILNPPPTFLPMPSLWVIPVHQPRASCIMHRTWTGDSFLIWCYTCFHAISPNHPTLSLSHRIQKTVPYICVFCCLAYRIIITIFLNSIYVLVYYIGVFLSGLLHSV